MSNDEDDFMSEESYEFEFEDDDDDVDTHSYHLQEQGTDHSVENRYYNAKALKDDSDVDALREFGIIVKEYPTEYEWTFKALKQIIKINFKLSNYDECLRYLRQLILVTPHIKHNYADESLTRMVNNYSVCRSSEFVHEFYNTLLKSFEASSNNNRLWLKIMISKLSLYLDNHQYENVPSAIKMIKEKLNNFDSEFKGLKLTYLPEVCAYEIEYLSQQRPLNINRLRQLHRESLRVATVLTHPRILGIIKECGGRLKFYRDNFEKARLDFYEAFKCYDEVGSQLKNQILKYVILCSIVTDHEANPFESQETQAYTQLSDYENLVALYDAYECLNLRRLQEVINDFKLSSDPLASDDIFLKSTALILDNLKSKILVRILSSFKSISFDTLTRLLEIELDDLDKRITHLVSEGVIFDIMVDYVSKVIFTGVTSNNIVTVDASSVLTNTKILDGLKWFEFSDFVKCMNPKSTEMVTSTLSCIVYTFSDSGISEQLEEWLRVIVTGIPTKRRNGLSQKDQVLYELAVDSANNRKGDNDNNNNNNIEGQNSSRALKNTNAGILGSALTMDDEGEEDPDQNEDTIRPDKAIREWCNALNDIRRGF